MSQISAADPAYDLLGRLLDDCEDAELPAHHQPPPVSPPTSAVDDLDAAARENETLALHQPDPPQPDIDYDR